MNPSLSENDLAQIEAQAKILTYRGQGYALEI